MFTKHIHHYKDLSIVNYFEIFIITMLYLFRNTSDLLKKSAIFINNVKPFNSQIGVQISVQ